MLESCKYVNHRNETIEFNQAGYIADLTALKNYQWQFNTLYKKISTFERKITKFNVPVLVYGENATELADRLYETMEKDVLATKSGRLFIGDYYMRGYFAESSKKRYSKDKTAISLTLVFVSDNPCWTSESEFSYRGEAASGGAGYPHDYPYSYIANSEMQNVINPSFVDANFKLVMYGPVENPQVVIGGHVHRVNTSIYRNEYLTIDSRDKTIVRTTSRGVKVNEFANRDLDNYVFEKIAPGENIIIPVADCPFDLTMYVERSEPKWT